MISVCHSIVKILQSKGEKVMDILQTLQQRILFNVYIDDLSTALNSHAMLMIYVLLPYLPVECNNY